MSDFLSRFRLDDKVVLITGGGQGIGKRMALTFAEVGAHIVVVDLNKDTAEAVAKQVKAMGRKSLALQVDVTDSAQITKMVKAAVKEFKRIDVLVNNAGGPKMGGPVISISDDVWEWHVKLNLDSVFMCSREVGRVMVAQNSGNILNISSVAGNRAVAGMAPYGATKAAVIQLTQIMACEFNRNNIRVNCITPKTILHPEFPMRPDSGPKMSPMERSRKMGLLINRVGEAEDIAAAALFLVSDAASYITGITLDVAGGPTYPVEIQERFDAMFPTSLKL